LVYSGNFGDTYAGIAVSSAWSGDTYFLPSINILDMDANSLALNFLAARTYNDGFIDVSSTTHSPVPNNTQRGLAEGDGGTTGRLYAATNTGTGSVTCSYSKSDSETPVYRIAGFRLYETSGNTIDTLDDPIYPGEPADITTTGLGDLTTNSTVGGVPVQAADAEDGDGTITPAPWTSGEEYPYAGTVTVTAIDVDDLETSDTTTLALVPGYTAVTVGSTINTGEWSVAKAFPGGDPLQEGEFIYYPDDGTGEILPNTDAVDFAAGTHVFWAHRYDGLLFSFNVTFGAGGVVVPNITAQAITSEGITAQAITSRAI
jgi:hypothetical protein